MNNSSAHDSNTMKPLRRLCAAATVALCVCTASSLAQESGNAKDWPKGTPKEFGIDSPKTRGL